jgi:hypothetical protein
MNKRLIVTTANNPMLVVSSLSAASRKRSLVTMHQIQI